MKDSQERPQEKLGHVTQDTWNTPRIFSWCLLKMYVLVHNCGVKQIMAHVWVSHVAHIHESCRPHEQVTCSFFLLHGQYSRGVSSRCICTNLYFSIHFVLILFDHEATHACNSVFLMQTSTPICLSLQCFVLTFSCLALFWFSFHMRGLRFVGSPTTSVSFAKEPYKRDWILYEKTVLTFSCLALFLCCVHMRWLGLLGSLKT